MTRHRVHSRTFALIAFVSSIVLGAVASLLRPDPPAPPEVTPAMMSQDTGATLSSTERLCRMPEYHQAMSALAEGRREEAASLLHRLADLPCLDEAQRTVCREKLRGLGR